MDDEAVARAAVPDVRLVTDYMGLDQPWSATVGGSLTGGYFGKNDGQTSRAVWSCARRHPRVVAWEKARGAVALRESKGAPWEK
jgi:hypothetical protein